ncbi:MAG: monooxygenase, partial [Xenococcaceae cyanobacterium]
NSEPKSPIIAHRSTANRFRHYEKIDLPDGFIALGDAVCALCPVYGQGMTVSALGAKTLQSWLKESSKNNLKVKRFQKKLAKTIFFPWNVAVTQDSRFSQITGKIPSNWLSRWLDKYSDRLIEKAASVTSLHALIVKVTHLLKSPLALYHPSVIFKVLITKK